MHDKSLLYESKQKLQKYYQQRGNSDSKKKKKKKKFNNKKQLRVRIKGNKGIKYYKKYKFINK